MKLKTTAGILLLAGTLVGNVQAREMSFEEFQDSCQNPSQYGHQNPPSKIRLMCHDVFNAWQPIESGVVELSESRLISSEIFSDKYHVSTSEFDLNVPERNAVCPRFREVVQTATLEVSKTCSDLQGEEVSLKELCQEALDQAIAENPDIVETTPSGRTFSVCGDSTQKP